MKISTKLALAAAVALGAIAPASASHSWNGYHWAGNGSSVALRVNLSIASKWGSATTGAVGGSITDWKQSSELSLTAQAVSRDPKKCSPIAGQVLVCNAAYGRRGWLGIASIWLQSGTKHITQATTKLNDSYHDYAPYNSAAWRSLVACQEIGHDWGLDHQDETFDNRNLGTCMDYTNAPAGGRLQPNGFDYGPSNEHPNSHDYAELSTIYNHDDHYTTATTATNFGIRQVGRAVPQSPPSQGIGDSPAEWGRAIHSDALGRPDVFVRDFSDGQRAITHVFWAPDFR